jgi:hypothetical protein
MSRRAKIIVYGIILLWMFCPMIPVAIASNIASAHGCKLDEGNPHPCIVFGKDIGGLLYEMFVMGWYCLFTIPTGIFALAAFTDRVFKKTDDPRI